MTDRQFSLPIDSIEVADRFRLDNGDLTALKASITELGLLHPVVVTAEGKLLAGARRLAACRELGWREVPSRVVDSIAAASVPLMAERDENTCRLDMKPSEAVRLGMAIEALDEERRAANRRANLDRSSRRNKGGGDSLLPSEPLGRAQAVVGPSVGLSGQTYGRAKAVVKAAENPAEAPQVREAAVVALGEMDRTGKVAPSWEKVKQAKDALPAPGEHAKWDKTTEKYAQVAQKTVGLVWKALHGVDVAGPALAGHDAELIVDTATPDEVRQMIEMADNAIRGLRQFQRNLRDRGIQ